MEAFSSLAEIAVSYRQHRERTFADYRAIIAATEAAAATLQNSTENTHVAFLKVSP